MHTAPAREFIFAVTALARGGTLTVLEQFWPRLEQRGRVRVISHGPDSVAVGPEVISVGGRFGGPMRFPAIWIYTWRMCWACVRASRNTHAFLLPQDSVATGAAAAIAGRLTKTPVIVMEHGNATAVRSRYYWRERVVMHRARDRATKPLLWASARLLHWLCVRLATGVLLAGDESEAAYVAAGIPAHLRRRYHFPVDLQRFRPAIAGEASGLRAQLRLPRDRIIVSSVSRLAPEKGLETIIEAVASAPHANRLLLAVAGEGPLRRSLEQAVRARGLDARFLGELDPDAVALLLRASDLFVYAGRQGANTPYAVLEAMASGLPVIATTEPRVHREMLDDGRGVAVDVDDAAAITMAIARFADHPAVRHETGARARRYIEQFHSPQRLDAELEEIVAWLDSTVRPRR